MSTYLFQLIARQSNELQIGTVGNRIGQFRQLIAGKHKFLKACAPSNGIGQTGQVVVGQNQPTKLGLQGIGMNGRQMVGLEGDHLYSFKFRENRQTKKTKC